MTRYLVAGTGIAGAESVRVLTRIGHEVVIYDQAESPRLAELEPLAAAVVTGDPSASVVTDAIASVDEVVLSPGIPPHHALARTAERLNRPVYSEPELAWRLRPAGAAPWLAVTGTNGKTTTVTMLAAILSAAGLRTEALGNIGRALVDAVFDDYDALVVELSSQQLHWSQTLAPQFGALLNLADDHLSWHGDAHSYMHAKTAIWRGAVNVGNLDDPQVAKLLSAAPGRHLGFTLGPASPGGFGVTDGVIVDHRDSEPVPLIEVDRIRPPGRHHVANALAAAAMARAFGVDAAAVAAGLAGYEPQPHRNVLIDTVDGVRYVDDSKGTNPHAAAAALASYDRIVWIAGGQLKGVDVDPLVASAADRLRGAVLLGVDRAELATSLSRHAPRIPVIEVARGDDEAMTEVVKAAAAMAQPGDVVLLSPAAASYDMFSGYAHRGRRFAEAVAALTSTPESA